MLPLLKMGEREAEAVVDAATGLVVHRQAGVIGRIEFTVEDLKQIVDCVNACVGLNPKAIPGLIETLSWVDWSATVSPEMRTSISVALGDVLTPEKVS